MEVTEGGVTLAVPEQAEDGTGDAVFYNPRQELNRDITVAALRAHRERAGDALSDTGEGLSGSYLDATAAAGVRGVRAAADGWRATLCDVDPDAVDLCASNLERNGLDDSGRVVHRNANALMHEERFDVVDLDPFGTPIPFADAAFRSARGLVCVTATDTAPLCGAHFRSGVRTYGAVPRNTEYHPEMGLRVLVSALVRTAARHDVAARPVLSHASDHYVRTYLELEHSARAADDILKGLGHLAHCPECLHREHAYGLIADTVSTCPTCGSDQVLMAGPLWLDSTRDDGFVAAVRDRLDDTMGTVDRAADLLTRLRSELDTPTHYDQHRLYKRWGEPAIAMDEFLGALRAAGQDASRTHYGGTTFKTTAGVEEVRDAVEGG